mgnify:CR=1 FL=1
MEKPHELAQDVCVYPGALGPGVCELIWKKFDADPRKSPMGNGTGLLEVARLPGWEVYQQEILRSLTAIFEDYATRVLDRKERLGPVGDDHYVLVKRDVDSEVDEHWDGADPSRLISVVFFLNQPEDGGEVFFRRQKLLVRPEQGAAIVYPACFTHPHQTRPPKDRDGFYLLTWVRRIEPPTNDPTRSA